MAKLNTVNVVEVAGGVVNSIRSFTNDEEGVEEAESIFKKIALENGAKENDLECHLDDGIFTIDDYDLIMVHSNN